MHIEFVHGWREYLYDTIRADETNLLVLDDQMCEASDSKDLARLFTKGSHHRNLTVIYLVQNVYDKGKSSRTVSLNAHYQVVFRNRRDASQFRVLASKMAPIRSGWLLDAFEDATSKPFGYLVIDNHPRTVDEHSFRSRIMPGEQTSFYSERCNEIPKIPESMDHFLPTNRRRPNPN